MAGVIDSLGPHVLRPCNRDHQTRRTMLTEAIRALRANRHLSPTERNERLRAYATELAG